MKTSCDYRNLPSSLLLLILTLVASPLSPVYAQGQTATIQLNQISTFSISSTSKTLDISLPQTPQSIVLSVELCTQIDGQQGPKFFASSNTGQVTSTTTTSKSATSSTSAGAGPQDPLVDEGEEVDMGSGLGLWTSADSLTNGGKLSVQLEQSNGAGTWSFSVGVSTNPNAPLHAVSSSSPYFGDSTGSSALLFSPPIQSTGQPFQEPTFPKYELPPSNPQSPSPPSTASSVNNTLIIISTSSIIDGNGNFKTNLNSSSCYLQTLASGNINTASSLVLRNQEEGWRTQYLVNGLQPSTNYTFYSLSTSQSISTLSQPAYFVTKSSSFSCPLVHSLPFCPQVGYSAPFPPVDTGSYDTSNFPPNLLETAIDSMGNFTSSLKTFACGRDLYSIIQTCASCERAYRNWVCSILIPRCGEVDPNLNPPAAIVQRTYGSSNTSSSASRIDQTVFSTNDGPTNYDEVLPCLEACHQVDRSCPPHMQWACPRKGINAERSYGVGFIDKEGDDISGGGTQGAGSTGMSQDQYGNVWCNGMV